MLASDLAADGTWRYNDGMTGSALEIEHRYGPRVHWLGDPFTASLLARIGSPAERPPGLLALVRTFYSRMLVDVASREFPAIDTAVETRMRAYTELGVWRGRALDDRSNVAIANVMRAGNLPSLACYELLTSILDPSRIRIDHFYFARRTDAKGQVVGVDSAGSKVGGSIEGSMVLVPDPMGATGGTTLEVLKAYRSRECGTPKRVIAMHLIVTPEYIRRVLSETDDVVIYTGRVDRGMTDPALMSTVPGTHLDRESGLNEVQYIVPGAGGVGEVLNNAYC